MAWRMAKSLDRLLKQLNEASPNRSKISDGGIGDAKHASRSSDHNPHVMDGKTGVVTARDFTHDPAHGVDARKLAEALVASRDNRIKYIISNGEIVSGQTGASPWVWRKYNGSNPHTKHVHISVRGEKALYDLTEDWAIPGVSPAKASKPAVEPKDPLLKRGASGDAVLRLQKLLGFTGKALDGKFGKGTEDAVKAFQLANKLEADGRVGVYTWDALKAKKQAAKIKVNEPAAVADLNLALTPAEILPPKLAGQTLKAGLVGSVVGGIAVDVLTDVIGKVLRDEAKDPDQPITPNVVPELLEKIVGAAAPAIATQIAPNTQKTVDAVVKNLGNEEPWYQSRVIVGGGVAVLAAVLGAIGYTVSPEDQQQLVLAIGGGIALAGQLYSLYGRIFGKKLKPLGE